MYHIFLSNTNSFICTKSLLYICHIFLSNTNSFICTKFDCICIIFFSLTLIVLFALNLYCIYVIYFYLTLIVLFALNLFLSVLSISINLSKFYLDRICFYLYLLSYSTSVILQTIFPIIFFPFISIFFNLYFINALLQLYPKSLIVWSWFNSVNPWNKQFIIVTR